MQARTTGSTSSPRRGGWRSRCRTVSPGSGARPCRPSPTRRVTAGAWPWAALPAAPSLPAAGQVSCSIATRSSHSLPPHPGRPFPIGYSSRAKTRHVALQAEGQSSHRRRCRALSNTASFPSISSRAGTKCPRQRCTDSSSTDSGSRGGGAAHCGGVAAIRPRRGRAPYPWPHRCAAAGTHKHSAGSSHAMVLLKA